MSKTLNLFESFNNIYKEDEQERFKKNFKHNKIDTIKGEVIDNETIYSEEAEDNYNVIYGEISFDNSTKLPKPGTIVYLDVYELLGNSDERDYVFKIINKEESKDE